MRTVAPLLALCLLTLAPPVMAAPRAGGAKPPPIVVELYTAQGCSACAKANSLVGDLAKRPGVLPLTFAVDYWDYLGWTDTFAKPEFVARQRSYMRRLSQREVYTPQVIVDGRTQAPGTRTTLVDSQIRDAAKGRLRAPKLAFFGGHFLRVESGPAVHGGAEVWLVRYEPGPDPVEIKGGEARGATVAYVNAVKELTRLGSWTGKRRTFPLPKAEDDGLKTVVVLQGVKGGRVIGVLQR
jgi:hypothetical protein